MPLPLLANQFGVGPFSLQVTIGMLSDDILLTIFRQYLDACPRFWPTLASMCKRWRQIVLTSPLGLNLRLYCTHRKPVLEALDCWSALPIIVQYGGSPNLDPPAPEDDHNIIAALKQFFRVTSISLTVTSSLLEKLSAISEPFPELEELALLCRDNIQLTLPSTFGWGPRLHTLHSTRIAFPSFPQLLLRSQDLVDLQLHEVPSAGYFPPEAFANALSGTTQLRSLSFHLLSFPPRRSYLIFPPPPGERILLPALTRLKYRGISRYLDSLAARIDAPHLVDIDITFFSQPTMDASQLGRFIERTDMQTSLTQAEVQSSPHAISILFTDSSTSTPLRLQISCKQLDWQLSCMAQVCDQFSPFLFRVEELRINTTESSRGQDDVGTVAGEQWWDLVRSFNDARDVWVADKLTNDILRALPPIDGDHATVLPALRHLHVENPMTVNELSFDALMLFINSRSLSGRPVQVNVPLSQCNICHTPFRQQIGLKLHLVDKHAYRVMCSYCTDFECTPGHDYPLVLREHLRRKHPEVAPNDGFISNPFLTRFSPSALERLVELHSSLREPDIVAPSPVAMAPHVQ